MGFPAAPPVVLSDEARSSLEALLRASSTPQALALRCCIVLRAADDDQPSNLQIAADLDCRRQTIGQWRKRFIENGLAGLQDLPRSGRPRSFSP